MEEFIMVLKRGESLRYKRSTILNERSSRSHTIIEFCLNHSSPTRKPARLLLCDLAGSEKYSDSRAGNKVTISESTAINKSLAALGRYRSPEQSGPGAVRQVERPEARSSGSLPRLEAHEDPAELPELRQPKLPHRELLPV